MPQHICTIKCYPEGDMMRRITLKQLSEMLCIHMLMKEPTSETNPWLHCTGALANGLQVSYSLIPFVHSSY